MVHTTSAPPAAAMIPMSIPVCESAALVRPAPTLIGMKGAGGFEGGGGGVEGGGGGGGRGGGLEGGGGGGGRAGGDGGGLGGGGKGGGENTTQEPSSTLASEL